MMIKNNNITLTALAAAGGALSALAWFQFCSGLVLLISFVPFFLLASSTEPNHERYGNRILFIRVLPGFLLFNTIALLWIRIAGMPILIAVITGNTFLMAFAFWLAWIIKQRAGKYTGGAAFVLFWLTMEYATNNVPVLSPWLNLGNGLAKETGLIQWYEATGVAGGTLWILLSNMTIAYIINLLIRKEGSLKLPVTAAICIIAIPPLLSLLTTRRQQPPITQPFEIVIIQPCIDPYTEKFTTGFEEQMDTILSMAGKASTIKTRWFITPETTIHDPINLALIDSNKYIKSVRNFLRGHPGAVFLLGAVTFSEDPVKTLHNSAILITSEGVTDIYHKSRLVPGIERSFSGPSRFLQNIFPELGGTTGGYTGQDSPSLLRHHTDGTATAPVICFESAFGEHVAGFVREGAGIIAVITNDGWLKNTHGYLQHLSFTSLRAIETRRTVIRAANTGVSAITDANGQIRARLPWWEAGTVTEIVYPASEVTFYVKYGDLISRTATSLTLFIVIIQMLALPIRRRISEKKF